MITKTLKNKVIAGVVFASVLGGAGTVFANTNAGGQLQSWYNNRFETSTGSLWSKAETYGNQKAREAYNWFNRVQATAKGSINTTKEEKSTEVKDAINNAKQEHIDAINATNTTIQNGMQGQYDTFITEKNSYISEEADKYTDIGTGIATKQITGAGSTAVTDLEGNLISTKNAARSALEAEISKVKGEINTLIDEKETAAEDSIKASIDSQISERKDLLTTLINQLQATAESNIQAKGIEVQDAAIEELQGLVDGIIN